MKISLVMIVRDEEKKLRRCLDSVKGIVDEIIIVDTGSVDGTKQVAREFTNHIYDYKWENNFANARNYAISKSSGDYNLVLDADEYIVGAEVRKEFDRVAKLGRIGKVIRIDSFRDGGEISYARNIISRFFPKGTIYEGDIHEQITSSLHTSLLNIEVMHDGYLDTDKSERNLEIIYKSLNNNPTDNYMIYQLAHTLIVSKNIKQGYEEYKKYYKVSRIEEPYRSGAVAEMIKVGGELKDFEYVTQLIKKERNTYTDFTDFHFQCAEFYRELVQSDVKRYIDYLPLIEESYLKCLDIGETTKYDNIEGTGSYLAAYNLGVWYEVTGLNEKAKVCYEISSEYGYDKAKERLDILSA